MRLDTNSHSDSEGSASGVGITTATSYHALPASDSPVSGCPFAANAAYPSQRTGKLYMVLTVIIRERIFGWVNDL